MAQSGCIERRGSALTPDKCKPVTEKSLSVTGVVPSIAKCQKFRVSSQQREPY